MAGIWRPESYVAFLSAIPNCDIFTRPAFVTKYFTNPFFILFFRIILYQIFKKEFIFDSYTCRINKGIHRAVKRLALFFRQVSHNYHQPVFALKFDVKKFFGAVDQKVLLKLLHKRTKDRNTVRLLGQIIESFYVSSGKRFPLGNVTSQLFPIFT